MVSERQPAPDERDQNLLDLSEDVADEPEEQAGVQPAAQGPSAPEQEVPESAQPPVPPSPASQGRQQPAAQDFLSQQLSEQQRRNAELTQQIQRQQLAQAEAAYRQQLETQGLDAHTAATLAAQQRQTAEQYIQLQTYAAQHVQNEQGRYRAALQYSRQYGVNADDLIGYDSPQAMERAAQQAQRVARLEQELAKLKQGKVPAQRLQEQGAAPVPAGINSLLNRAANGERLSDEEWKLLGSRGYK